MTKKNIKNRDYLEEVLSTSLSDKERNEIKLEVYWKKRYNEIVVSNMIEKYSSVNEYRSHKGYMQVYTDTEKENIRIQKEIHKNNRKNSGYGTVFKQKARKMLSEARVWTWCVRCSSAKLLNVHHIDKNKNNNEDCNLMVLCYDCHSEHHKHMQGRKPPVWLR